MEMVPQTDNKLTIENYLPEAEFTARADNLGMRVYPYNRIESANYIELDMTQEEFLQFAHENNISCIFCKYMYLRYAHVYICGDHFRENSRNGNIRDLVFDYNEYRKLMDDLEIGEAFWYHADRLCRPNDSTLAQELYDFYDYIEDDDDVKYRKEAKEAVDYAMSEDNLSSVEKRILEEISAYNKMQDIHMLETPSRIFLACVKDGVMYRLQWVVSYDVTATSAMLRILEKVKAEVIESILAREEDAKKELADYILSDERFWLCSNRDLRKEYMQRLQETGKYHTLIKEARLQNTLINFLDLLYREYKEEQLAEKRKKK